MPFITTVAKMEWTGVGFDQERYDIITDTYRTSIKKLKKKIAKHGIGNPLSHQALQRFFKSAGIINRFALRGKYSFEKGQLKRNLDAHPIVRELLNYRQLSNLLRSASKLEDFVAFDDRIHAQYHSVGAVSGRLTTHNPNIVGLDSRLRHLITPEPGNGIGEADWCQFEVGIAAVVYGDEKLLNMFNNGDVYTLMAKEFFKDKISKSDRKLSDRKFKQRYPNLRKKMKTCVLGVIYGMTSSAMSELLKCSRMEAQQLYRKFLQMFPSLSKAREETHINNKRRGCATTTTGLKRYRSKINSRHVGKEKWLINHPIQGTAAAIFKMTASRLDKLYRLHDARIIIPMHDAFVFEAPIDELDQVAHLTERVMCETVREFYPMLQPRVEIDTGSPAHWGKKSKIRLL
jgi:DNA polymerase-1